MLRLFQQNNLNSGKYEGRMQLNLIVWKFFEFHGSPSYVYL